MATYEREIIGANIYYSEKERYIYGSARLGVIMKLSSCQQLLVLHQQLNLQQACIWTQKGGKILVRKF
ncbi:MAG: hypothetical protein V4638_09310 [Bacteroidota bacterium]